MALIWTQRATPTADNDKWRAIAYSAALGLFCAVGTQNSGASANRIMTSPDGVTWTERAAPSSSYSLFGVAWSPSLGLFVATGSANLIATSPDGTTWTAQTGPTGANNGNNIWNSVIWSPGLSLFIAANTRGTGTAPAASHNLMTSPDGINWTGRNVVSKSDSTTTNGFGAPQLVDCPSLGTVMLVGLIGSTRNIFTSTTGTAFTYRVSDSSAGASSGSDECWIAWSSTLSLAACVLGRGDNPIYTSPDGVVWTQRTAPTTGANRPIWKQLVWFGDRFVGVGLAGSTNTNQIIQSTDGITWTESDPGVATVEPWNFLSASGTTLVAVASNATNDGHSVLSGLNPADAVSPASGHLGGGYTLTIGSAGGNGGFAAGARVIIDDLSALGAITPGSEILNIASGLFAEATNVVVVDAYTLTCAAPIGFGLQAALSERIKSVLVVNANLGAPNIACYLPNGFTYLDATLSGIVASSGPASGGTSVTITGTNLYPQGGSTAPTSNGVTFGGNAATSVVVASSTSITCVVPAATSLTNPVDVVFAPQVWSPLVSAYLTAPTATLPASYTYTPVTFKLNWSGPWDMYTGPLIFADDYVLTFDFWYQNIYYPVGQRIPWTPTTAPVDTGWWLSINEDFAGSANILYNTRPKDPRSYREVVSFATGSAATLGGFPGPACVFDNKLVYAEGAYTVGTTSPIIRIYSGLFDREVARLPNTPTSTVPKAVMSMITGGGTIYVATLDSGSSSADFLGRVFSLDLESGTLTQVGASPFATGHVPYALAWHAGRLWCGTNRQSSAAAGKVYYIRPGIDTNWTDDYTLSTSSVAGVSSLLSFQGQLYVGTTAAAATFAKVLVRSELGAYTTSQTGTGGAAAANNGYLALAEFGGNLYASYWNPDATKISKIQKFDAATWSTVYNGATTTLVPYIGFPTDTDVLFALGGSVPYAGTLLSTANGTAWTDRTAFLPQETPNSTGLPVFGVVGR